VMSDIDGKVQGFVTFRLDMGCITEVLLTSISLSFSHLFACRYTHNSFRPLCYIGSGCKASTASVHLDHELNVGVWYSA
jgi:hypothetical protein